MRHYVLLLVAVAYCSVITAQHAQSFLTVEKIMRDPKWIGTSPQNPRWGADGHTLYFDWNPEKAFSDSVYKIQTTSRTPQKASPKEKREYVTDEAVKYNQARTAAAWVKNGDVFYRSPLNKTIQVTNTVENEYGAAFSFNDRRIVYTKDQNLFSWDIETGITEQLINFGSAATSPRPKLPPQEEWLKQDQLSYMKVLQERKAKRDAAEQYQKAHEIKKLKPIETNGKTPGNLTISPDGRFVLYTLYTQGSGRRTFVPEFVTESGFTESIPTRTKVGTQQGASTGYIYDRLKDTSYKISVSAIPGIKDIPEYVKEYPALLQKMQKADAERSVSFVGFYWSPGAKYAVVDIRATDNKDRWLMVVDTATRALQTLDRQHDEAWIGGPGIYRNAGWIDNETFWFQSEATGYSHLYTYHIPTNKRTALTAGSFEVQTAQLSNDKRSFYITTNEVHPGEKHFYKLNIATKNLQRLTFMPGSNEVVLSPDEKFLAIRHSYINQPWELYLQQNKPGAKPVQITRLAMSDEFKQYQWQVPEVITFTASDGAAVYARVYKPQYPHPSRPAVLFVHGAGYLQNAHKWWSSYFREYMFNNLLADNGYYVMDIDYRASAGYGRDWRTGIYRHMGGKDLSDHVDAVKYMADSLGVNPENIGIYGGSYGGFITLMALFTQPDVFKSGAALRSVTDWANYNHGYTSNILNEPFTDSIAYRRSSPIYFAGGLKGHLLMAHGMVDVNVHYQDIIKLIQRLIELGKENWELASYPVEDHGFVEPDSWRDEYQRILKLFETSLKQ